MKICSNCSQQAPEAAKFCSACGAPFAQSPAQPIQMPPVYAEQEIAPPPPDRGLQFTWNRGPQGGVHRKMEATQVDGNAPPSVSQRPPPPPGQTYRMDSGPPPQPGPTLEAPEGPSEVQKPGKPEPLLYPPGQTWGFQDKLTEIAAKAIAVLEQSGLSARTGLGGMLPRMIRATLLDKAIYREVAANASLQGEAWQVIILVIVLSSSGTLIAAIQHLSPSLLFSIAPTAAIQVVAILVRIWLTQFAASSWLKTPTSFHQFFRALAYAHSPVSLQIIPMVGQFMGLWSLITSTAAIRDVTGCSTRNAAILAIVTILGTMVAVSFAAPFIQTLLAIF